MLSLVIEAWSVSTCLLFPQLALQNMFTEIVSLLGLNYSYEKRNMSNFVWHTYRIKYFIIFYSPMGIYFLLLLRIKFILFCTKAAAIFRVE